LTVIQNREARGMNPLPLRYGSHSLASRIAPAAGAASHFANFIAFEAEKTSAQSAWGIRESALK
jgi:hypothetical protein